MRHQGFVEQGLLLDAVNVLAAILTTADGPGNRSSTALRQVLRRHFSLTETWVRREDLF
jgi:hypothetical protein